MSEHVQKQFVVLEKAVIQTKNIHCNMSFYPVSFTVKWISDIVAVSLLEVTSHWWIACLEKVWTPSSLVHKINAIQHGHLFIYLEPKKKEIYSKREIVALSEELRYENNIMDKIWYRNPSKSEVIGRCGGDEKSNAKITFFLVKAILYIIFNF